MTTTKEIDTVSLINEFERRYLNDPKISEYAKRRPIRPWAESLIQDFKSVDGTYERYRNGTLDHWNRHSRWLFEQLHQVRLPKTRGRVFEVLKEVFGDSLTQHIRSVEEDERREKEENERSLLEATRKLNEERLKKIADLVANEKPLTAEDLVFAATELGIEVHPRTVGSLKRFFALIYKDKANVYERRDGRRPKVGTACALYRELQEVIREKGIASDEVRN